MCFETLMVASMYSKIPPTEYKDHIGSLSSKRPGGLINADVRVQSVGNPKFMLSNRVVIKIHVLWQINLVRHGVRTWFPRISIPNCIRKQPVCIQIGWTICCTSVWRFFANLLLSETRFLPNNDNLQQWFELKLDTWIENRCKLHMSESILSPGICCSNKSIF